VSPRESSASIALSMPHRSPPKPEHAANGPEPGFVTQISDLISFAIAWAPVPPIGM